MNNESKSDFKFTHQEGIFDLEERSFLFARRCRDYVKKLPRTVSNIEYGKQLIRSSGSVGANYIEANEALGHKDFVMHIKISRKEAKESRHWLRLTVPILAFFRISCFGFRI